MTLRFAAVPPSAMLEGGAALTLRCALASLASANAGNVQLNSIWDSNVGATVTIPASVNSASCGGGRRAAATGGAHGVLVLRGGGGGRTAQAAAATPTASSLPPGAGSIVVFKVSFPVSAGVDDSDGTGGALIQDMAMRSQAAADAITQATSIGDCSSASGSSCCGLATNSLCPFLVQLSAASGVPLSALLQSVGRTSLGTPLLPSPHSAAANPASMSAGMQQLGPAPLGGVIASAALVLTCAGLLALRRHRDKAMARQGNVRSKGAAAFSPHSLHSPVVNFTSMNPMWSREIGGGAGESFVDDIGSGESEGGFGLVASVARQHADRLAARVRSPAARRPAVGRGHRSTPLLERAPLSTEAPRPLPAAVTEFAEEATTSEARDGTESSLQQQLSRAIQKHVVRSIEAASSVWLHPPGELRNDSASPGSLLQLQVSRSAAASPGALSQLGDSALARPSLHTLLAARSLPAADEMGATGAREGGGSPLVLQQPSTRVQTRDAARQTDEAPQNSLIECEEDSISVRPVSPKTVLPQIRTKWPPQVPRGSASPGAMSGGPGVSALARALAKVPRPTPSPASTGDELDTSEAWDGTGLPLQQHPRSSQRPNNLESRARPYLSDGNGDELASVGAASPEASSQPIVSRSPADPGALSEPEVSSPARVSSPFKHSSLRG